MKQKSGYEMKTRIREGIKARALTMVLYALCSLLCALFTPAASCADDNPLIRLRDETVSYFKPMTGKITMVEDKKVVINLGAKDSVRAGMRFNILREEAPFRHPVTKEILGKMESSVGKLEIVEARPESATGSIIAGDAKEGDKVRISEIKVNVLFSQAKDIDWNLADSYYRNLKETGRFNMIDTDVETEDTTKIIDEARRLNADVALLLTAKAADSGTLLTQRLFWVADSLKFAETDTRVDSAYAKELRFGEELFAQDKEESLLQFDLPYGARLITMGDINGDGKQELIVSTGKDIMVYTPGVDLQPALGGSKLKGATLDDDLWLDSIDLNKNGKDEIVITAMKRDEIVSYIYEWSGTEFTLLYKDNVFLRRIENRLIAQEYSRAEGFDGPVFDIVWEGGYKKGSEVKLPKGVNIYDFEYFDDPQAGRLIVAYDEKGFINLYDNNGMKLWRSGTGTGGFLSTFQKAAPTTMVDRGEWAIKDRLLPRNREILFVKRVPLLGVMKVLGFKSSQIKKLWWNGLSAEESVLIDNIKGAVLDYISSGDKIIVLASPMFGIIAGNILKGENPLRTMLYIY
jgi:hypothetical protein